MRDIISYKHLLVLLLGILSREMTKEKYDALLDLLCISYKLEVEKSWKNSLISLKK